MAFDEEVPLLTRSGKEVGRLQIDRESGEFKGYLNESVIGFVADAYSVGAMAVEMGGVDKARKIEDGSAPKSEEEATYRSTVALENIHKDLQQVITILKKGK